MLAIHGVSKSRTQQQLKNKCVKVHAELNVFSKSTQGIPRDWCTAQAHTEESNGWAFGLQSYTKPKTQPQFGRMSQVMPPARCPGERFFPRSETLALTSSEHHQQHAQTSPAVSFTSLSLNNWPIYPHSEVFPTHLIPNVDFFFSKHLQLKVAD